MTTENKLHQHLNFTIDPYGDGMAADFIIPRGEVTLFPSNGNTANLTVTLKYSDGSPAPGKAVTCQSRPLTLAGADWRNVNGLAPRFAGSQQTIRDRIDQVSSCAWPSTPSRSRAPAGSPSSCSRGCRGSWARP